MLTYNALIERGWTAELIKEYLPPPAIYEDCNGQRYELWNSEIVRKAEQEYCLDIADNSPRVLI